MENIEDIIRQNLGVAGRMISGSKSGYRQVNPDNAVIFNANIIASNLETQDHAKVWYGDLDITLDELALNEIAKISGLKLYILYEMDGRFEHEDDPQVHKYVFCTDGTMSIAPKYTGHYTRLTTDGPITVKR